MAPTASLVLPAPNIAAQTGDYEAGSKAARVEEVDEVTEQSTSRFSSGGIIYPPPELRALVDKTATFVARNGTQFESRIRDEGTSSNKLAFLNEKDPYHAYYRAKIEAVVSGQGALAGTESTATASPYGGTAGEPGVQKEDDGRPAEPDPFYFSTDMPNITAVDLDILKLTALFTARKGRSFASSLATREGRSYQFEFLRPSHSLFGYFNRMVEQYRLVMEPSAEIKANTRYGAFGSSEEPSKTAEPLLGVGRGGARLKVLEQVRARAEWQKWDKARRRLAVEEEEKEKDAFNEIDWQDFVVAGTVELTETDAHIDLPPPMSLREMENMSMAQKRMAAMIAEVEGGTDEPDASLGAPLGIAREDGDGDGDGDVEMEMDDSDEETPTVQRTNASNGPMKIRKDYQPKSLAERKAAVTPQSTICPVCKTAVPLDQMDEHVKYELLNPHYREQRRELESKKAEQNALMEGADPSRFLKQFAGRRTDIFGSAAEEEAQRRREEEEARKRKEREKLVWDGHAASRVETANAFNRPEQLQEEAQHIQKKFKTDQEKVYIGPQMGAEGATATPPPAAQNTMAAGVVSYGVQAAPATTSQPVADATYAGYPGYAPTPQYNLERRTDGVLYPEEQWLQYHPEPITVLVQMPESPSVSEKCDGSQVLLEALPPGTTIGTIRDKVQSDTLGGGVGASRLKLRVDGKATTLRQTLAHWNLINGSIIALQVN